MGNNSQFSTLNSQLFNRVYKGKTVLITGHTGFKGSWLALWLKNIGANVVGYSLEPITNPNHFELLFENNSQFSILNSQLISVIGDIRDKTKLEKTFKQYKPEIVFHLAAQPLVRLSYKIPFETFETNVMGTLNIFECCRKTPSVKAILNITSDKCYENKEWMLGYKENDSMGGFDPYSASKGCSELLTNCYRNSFFNLKNYGKNHNILLASCRAGNVIGGGDWSEDRLIPDIVKATVKNKKVIIRNPNAVRPWQHVLEPLSGYLLLGKKLLEGKKEFADAWNFGPNEDEGNLSVLNVVKKMKSFWSKINYEIEKNDKNVHEANLLKLDCKKANTILKWRSIWDNKTTFEKTANWYKEFYEKNICLSALDLKDYLDTAKLKSVEY